MVVLVVSFGNSIPHVSIWPLLHLMGRMRYCLVICLFGDWLMPVSLHALPDTSTVITGQDCVIVYLSCCVTHT